MLSVQEFELSEAYTLNLPGALPLIRHGLGLLAAILIDLGSINLPISMPIDHPEMP